jgi:hypothetical protein
VHQENFGCDEGIQLRVVGTLSKVVACGPRNHAPVEVQFLGIRSSRKLVGELRFARRLLATFPHAREDVGPGCPPLQKLFERDDLLARGSRIRPAQRLGTLPGRLRVLLLLEGALGLFLEDLGAVRVVDPARDQIIAVHQEMEPDVPIRGVDLDERLALAEVAARLGRPRDGRARPENENDTGCGPDGRERWSRLHAQSPAVRQGKVERFRVGDRVFERSW